MHDLEQRWCQQGATLSDKTARKEYGLSHDEIIEAIQVGKLHCRVASMHGHPWFRLLRGEVEDLVRASRGQDHLEERQATAELTRIDNELRRLRAELTQWEKRRAELAARLARAHHDKG